MTTYATLPKFTTGSATTVIRSELIGRVAL